MFFYSTHIFFFHTIIDKKMRLYLQKWQKSWYRFRCNTVFHARKNVENILHHSISQRKFPFLSCQTRTFKVLHKKKRGQKNDTKSS